MNNYNWVMQVALGMFFLMPALNKIKTSRKILVAKGNMSPDASISFIRFLGVAEVLGVLAMIIPIWFKVLHPITAIAAIGFSVVMITASVVHFRKRELKKLPIITLALVLSVIVAINNF